MTDNSRQPRRRQPGASPNSDSSEGADHRLAGGLHLLEHGTRGRGGATQRGEQDGLLSGATV